MYVTGKCPDYYFNYEWSTAPKREEIANFCLPIKSTSYSDIIGQIQQQRMVRVSRSNRAPLPAPVVSALLLQRDCIDYIPSQYHQLHLMIPSDKKNDIEYLLAFYDSIENHVAATPYSIETINHISRKEIQKLQEKVDYLLIQPSVPSQSSSKRFEITRPLLMIFQKD